MILYAITDRRLEPGRDLRAQVSKLFGLGVDWVQIREKDLSASELFSAVAALAPEARRMGIKLLVNERADIAAGAGAAGVHLTSSSPAVERVREKLPPPFFIVASCHSRDEAVRAAGSGADAVTLGPVFETPSKAGYGPPLGLERFADAVSACACPVIGLGGIGRGQAKQVIKCGAAGVAAIRMFAAMSSDDLGGRNIHPVLVESF